MSIEMEPMTKKEAKMYKFSTYQAIGIAEGFEDASEPREVLAAWQHISDHGLWKGLQGFFGRTVYSLKSDGMIEV